MVAASGLQCGEVALEIECVDEDAHLRDEAGIFGCSVLKLIQLLLDAPDVPNLAESDGSLMSRDGSRGSDTAGEVLAAGMACVS
jgi:hypothetical protein